MKIINICFLTDDSYAMPTGVAIKSLCESKNKNTVYNIYILAIDVSSKNKRIFKSMGEENVSIKIIQLKNEYEGHSIDGISATPTAMYKFKIPDILASVDRIIYLDGDIIVKTDLSNLYNFDICDNYIGAVLDINGVLKHHYKMFIKHNIFYFNSGVMLMNLKKMREENISEKLIDYRLNGYNELMDQDALNYVLKGNVAELPFKYNTQTMYTTINMSMQQLKRVLRLSNKFEKYEDIANDSSILHYSLKSKPWKNNNIFMFDIWNRYYNASLYKNVVKITYCNNDIHKKGIYQKVLNLAKNNRRYKFFKKFAKLRK